MFEIDMEHCLNCGGELKIIAAILEQPVIEKILTHLGLQADCGRRSAPARGLAPQEGFALASANAACKAVHPPGASPRPGATSRARTQTVRWTVCVWRGVGPLARRALQGA